LQLLCAVAGLIGTPAFAADIAVKAPPPAPAPVYNWTGWYAGVNAGASMGSDKTTLNGGPLFAQGIAVPGSLQFTPGFGFSDQQYPSGFIGGGQIGYNWQWSPLIVVGLEADIQGALERETDNLSPQNLGSFSNPVFNSTFLDSATAVTSYTTQIDWFGTVRARLGYVWGNGEVLSYVTGGLAYGEVKINGATTVSGFGCVTNSGCSNFSNTEAFGQSHVNTGWVLGYGTEGKLLIPGWTYKIASLYMDLGHLNTTSTTSASSSSFPNPVSLTGGQVTNTHVTDWILRGGLNYQFH
jgi:outer membrane immunogenic protein